MGRLVLRLDEPTGGDICFEGVDLAGLNRGDMIAVRKKMQVIFQDPYSSLNPRMTVGQIVAEPMRVHEHSAQAADRTARGGAAAAGGPVPLHGAALSRMNCRAASASASASPGRSPSTRDVIVCDEAVSALDVSIQGQVINLLEDLQQKLGLTYLFIAHDLAVVRHISSKVAVMYLGRIVEYAAADELFANPKHPYTQGAAGRGAHPRSGHRAHAAALDHQG